MMVIVVVLVMTEFHNRPGIGEPASWEGRVCTRWFQGGRSLIFYKTTYVNVDSPNLGFPYFNFLGEARCKKKPCMIVSIISITAQLEKLLSGFGITVDIEDESSGTWMPIPPDSSHSLAQSG